MVKPEDLNDKTKNESAASERVEKGADADVEALVKTEGEVVEAEVNLAESGDEIVKHKTAGMEDDPAATGFNIEADALSKEAESAKSTLEKDLTQITENVNESEIQEKLAEIKQALISLDSAKLNVTNKKKVLKKISQDIGDLYGNTIDDTSTDFFKTHPELQEIVGLMNRIDDDIANSKKNESDSPAESEKTSDNENSAETNTESEISLDPIREKIKNNETLNVEEEKYLLNKSQEIIDKQTKREAVSQEETDIILLYQEAFNKGLVTKGAEMNEFIDENDEEIRAFKEKSKEEKDKDINERLEKIKNSGIELSDKVEDAQMHLEELKKQLKEKNDEFVKMEEDLEKIRDAEGVDPEGARILINTVSSLRNIYKNELHIEYYEYWMEHLRGGNENLYDSHAFRNMSMNNLEKLSGDLESDLEDMQKGEEEVLRKWAQYIKDHPKLGLALIAAALIAGIALSPYIIKMLGTEGATKAGLAIATPAGKAIGLAGAKALGSLASLTGNLGLAGIFLLLTNSKKMDETMESIWGKKVPGWASWGLKKDNKK